MLKKYASFLLKTGITIIETDEKANRHES